MFFPDLSKRRRHHELMDEPDVDPRHLAKSLRFLRRANRAFGYTRAMLGYFDRFSRGWPKGEAIRILDIGTGSADVPRAILAWADRRGFDVRVTGIDLHEQTIAAAAANSDPRLTLLRCDALAMPFAENSFDYCITSTFLHHLDDTDVVKVMAAMGRLAKRGVIIADLIRNRRAYFWISLVAQFTNPVVRHDGPVSVAQAFTRNEAIALRDAAGLGFTTYHKHFGHRFVLVGEKQGVREGVS
jgi:SAM-dependent methyltransferase